MQDDVEAAKCALRAARGGTVVVRAEGEACACACTGCMAVTGQVMSELCRVSVAPSV